MCIHGWLSVWCYTQDVYSGLEKHVLGELREPKKLTTTHLMQIHNLVGNRASLLNEIPYGRGAKAGRNYFL